MSITKSEIYLEKFSETGLPVFEKAAELARQRAQYHIGDGHIVIALSALSPYWFAVAVSKHDVRQEQILTAAENHVKRISPYTKGGLKIHPSAEAFFRRAMKLAKSNERLQIDCLDLIAALDSYIEDLILEQRNFKPGLVERAQRLRKLFG